MAPFELVAEYPAATNVLAAGDAPERNNPLPATKLLTTALESWLNGAKVPANGSDPIEFHKAISPAHDEKAIPVPSRKIQPQFVSLFMAPRS